MNKIYLKSTLDENEDLKNLADLLKKLEDNHAISSRNNFLLDYDITEDSLVLDIDESQITDKSEFEKIMDDSKKMFSDKVVNGKVEIPVNEFIDEHTRIVNELLKDENLDQEAADQASELVNVAKMMSSNSASPDKGKWKQWKSLVNMTESELKDFYNSELGKEAGLDEKIAEKLGIHSGRESARWLMKMIPVGDSYEKVEKNWTPEEWAWCYRQVNFINRMNGVLDKMKDPYPNGIPSRCVTSLMIWGHDPKKDKTRNFSDSNFNLSKFLKSAETNEEFLNWLKNHQGLPQPPYTKKDFYEGLCGYLVGFAKLKNPSINIYNFEGEYHHEPPSMQN